MSDHSILIVIVNFRTAAMVIDCLESLEPEMAAHPRAQVVVVENASGDDSLEVLAEAIDRRGWQSWVTLLPVDTNAGFAAGNNAAIAPALQSESPPDLIWLLNPDTIVRPGGLAALVAYLDDHPQCGLVGSRLEHLDGTPQRSAFRFYSIASELENGIRLGLVSRLLARQLTSPPVSDVAIPTDWVCGASLLIRRAVFDAVGLLDDRYFMYYEESDFCLRARRAGFPCAYEPSSRIVHLGGRLPGAAHGKQPAKRRPKFWFESRHLYFLANHGLAYTALCDLVWGSGYAVYRLRSALTRKPNHDSPHVLSDFLKYTFSRRAWRIPPRRALPAARVQPRNPAPVHQPVE